MGWKCAAALTLAVTVALWVSTTATAVLLLVGHQVAHQLLLLRRGVLPANILILAVHPLMLYIANYLLLSLIVVLHILLGKHRALWVLVLFWLRSVLFTDLLNYFHIFHTSQVTLIICDTVIYDECWLVHIQVVLWRTVTFLMLCITAIHKCVFLYMSASWCLLLLIYHHIVLLYALFPTTCRSSSIILLTVLLLLYRLILFSDLVIKWFLVCAQFLILIQQSPLEFIISLWIVRYHYILVWLLLFTSIGRLQNTSSSSA